MKARQQRMIFIGAVVAAMLASAAFAYRAFKENLLYFYSPSQVLAGEAPAERRFRLGGLVVEGSLHRVPGTLTASFRVTDLEEEVEVEHTGVFPDLFKEGKGVVAHGRLQADGLFVADDILAKHDENYMSPEVADALAEAEGRAGE
jgi:cytochrome c-type biogenesis protein CcmE